MQNDGTKSFDLEVSENLETILKKIKELLPQKVYLSSWKGVDDILDNVSGVNIISEVGRPLSSITLVQLDCHNDYQALAKAIMEKTLTHLQDQGFTVVIKSTIS